MDAPRDQNRCPLGGQKKEGWVVAGRPFFKNNTYILFHLGFFKKRKALINRAVSDIGKGFGFCEKEKESYCKTANSGSNERCGPQEAFLASSNSAIDGRESTRYLGQ